MKFDLPAVETLGRREKLKMTHHRRAPALVVTALLFLSPAFAAAQSAAVSSDLKDGIEQFKIGQYDKAILLFHNVIMDPSADAQKPAAYLLIAKAYMAAGKLPEAAQNLEFYLSNYTGGQEYEEALYQKGRLLFMQEDFDNAIQVLQSFISAYPRSTFVSSAWFWAAECLYGLGRLDDALAVYQKVITGYPSSVKVEASQYKISLIQLRRKEVELSTLLKWSHEDFLKSVEEYQNREKAYEQAIQAYQKRLAASTAEDDRRTIASLRDELARKNDQVKLLQAQNDALRAAAANQASAASSGTGSASVGTSGSMTMVNDDDQGAADQEERKALVQRATAARQSALELKERYLAWISSHGGDSK
jgi:TolA-binding protein